MKTNSVVLLSLIVCVSILRAADEAQVSALKAADDERVAAIVAADRARLTASFSDDLRYAHSSGNVNKASYVESIASGKLKYVIYDYIERNFTLPAPTIALMTAKVHIKAMTSTGENDAVMSILAAWRLEDGKWRFLAWQSAKLPPAPAAK